MINNIINEGKINYEILEGINKDLAHEIETNMTDIFTKQQMIIDKYCINEFNTIINIIIDAEDTIYDFLYNRDGGYVRVNTIDKMSLRVLEFDGIEI